MTGVQAGSLRGAVMQMVEAGLSQAAIRAELAPITNAKTLESYLNTVGCPEGGHKLWWFRARRAGIMHLIDLKKAGHSARETERGVSRRTPCITLPPIVRKPSVDVPPGASPLLARQGDQEDAHVVAWRRHAMGLKRKEPPVSLIIAATARCYCVSQDEIRSAVRLARIVRPRQVAMFIASEMTSLSLPQTGKLIGGRDHTTVLHGVRKIAAIKDRPDIAEALATIRADVEANFSRIEARP